MILVIFIVPKRESTHLFKYFESALWCEFRSLQSSIILLIINKQSLYVEKNG